ncbi:MAG: metal ABC transporter ATP-binding protein [Acidimicrobiales bacterium]
MVPTTAATPAMAQSFGSTHGRAVISGRGVAAAYGASTVWAGADFDIEDGEFVPVLGPNGAGKSTFLRLVLGLMAPASGTLAVLGRRPHRGNPAIGYVPQRRDIDPGLRIAGSELVRMGIDGHRWGVGSPRDRRTRDRRVADAVEAVDATAYADQALGTLSGGELQRLLLAQAIVNEPRLLLLDEPLASLDVRNQMVVTQLVAAISRSRNMTVVLIAHDVNPLLGVLDRVMYVARGRVTIGLPDEVITSARLSELYQSNVEVLKDSRGRIFVAGLDGETDHPHGAHEHRGDHA